jgi:hypothetical protein
MSFHAVSVELNLVCIEQDPRVECCADRFLADATVADARVERFAICTIAHSTAEASSFNGGHGFS